ncbi:MAG: histidine kinase [Lachnospiraceae bacterium]|nr:histidine kinase [Lachnospiraceae bacterium]
MKEKKSHRSIFQNLIQYRHNSILIRNFGLVFFMMLLPLLLLILIVRTNMDEIVQQEISEANNNSLTITAKTMDSILDQIFSFAYFMEKSDSYKWLYMSEESELIERYDDIYEDRIRSYSLIEMYIDSIYIYLEKKELVLNKDQGGGKVFSSEEIEDSSWLKYYKEYMQEGETGNYIFCYRNKNGYYPRLLTMMCLDRIEKNTVQGAVVVNIDLRKLNQHLGLSKNSELKFYTIDEEGYLYYTNEEELLSEDAKVPDNMDFLWKEDLTESQIREMNGASYVISMQKSTNWGFRYVLCSPMSFYEERMERVDMIIQTIVILTIVMGILVAYIVTLHSFAPIQRIMNEISIQNTVEEVFLEEQFINKDEDEDVKNELQYITRTVRETGRKNKRLKMESEVWMKKLNNAQMLALQSQINPHYLYNTLDAINWDAIEQLGSDNSVSEMITDLAQFLRIGLQRSSYLIQISEELEHAKLYVRILKARYEDSIRVEWDVDDAILSYKVIRLSVQPLIENALEHGLRPKRYEGTIWIRGGVMDDIVYLSVEDDGVGMEEEDCIAFNCELMTNYEADSDHVGVRNVNQRMKILFGDDYGVNLTRRRGGGMIVRLIFPKCE